jgi:hypothetical protein
MIKKLHQRERDILDYRDIWVEQMYVLQTC